MGCSADQGDFQPRLTLSMRDNADYLPFGFEDWALFNMIFKIDVHCSVLDTNRLVAQPPSPFNVITQGLAILVFQAMCIVERIDTGKYSRCQRMDGTKRKPSSLVQLVTTIGCFVFMSRSFIIRAASSADGTPRTPSYLPPVGCVSRCEPI